MVQKNSNQKAGATSHQPHSRDIAIATINVIVYTRTNDMSAQHTQPASRRGVSNFILKELSSYQIITN